MGEGGVIFKEFNSVIWCWGNKNPWVYKKRTKGSDTDGVFIAVYKHNNKHFPLLLSPQPSVYLHQVRSPHPRPPAYRSAVQQSPTLRLSNTDFLTIELLNTVILHYSVILTL